MHVITKVIAEKHRQLKGVSGDTAENCESRLSGFVLNFNCGMLLETLGDAV